MKKLLPLLALLLVLAACAKPQTSAPEPESEPETAPVVTPVQEEPEPEPAAPEEAKAEEPVEEDPALPDLPYPVYCWGNTAVSRDGTVILQVPDHTLELCFDEVTGKPAGILSTPSNISWSTLYDGFYALDGTPVLTEVGMPYFRCYGDLGWYGILGEYTVLRLSDGTMLRDGLQAVEPAGDYLALQPNYWNDRCVLVDKTGQTVLELDRGFELSMVYQDRGSAYLAMSNALDGTMNLVNTKGETMLDRFYDEVADVSQGCAIVRDGSQYRAIDLATGAVEFTWDQLFTLLPEGVLAGTSQGTMLADRQGNRLYSRLLNSPYVYDWDGDGDPEYILASTMQDAYTVLVLVPDGTELASVPDHLVPLRSLSPTSLAYTTSTGTEAMCFEAHLVDLQTGSDTVLTSGKNLYAQFITTSGGQMLLCTMEDDALLFLNDGTPARTDLGPCTYLGGDVFACEEGLRCLDGSWLYRPE